MEEHIKPRFKVDEPVYVIAFGETDRAKGYITYIQKVHGYHTVDGKVVEYYYYLYTVDAKACTGKRTPQFAEEFIQERYVHLY